MNIGIIGMGVMGHNLALNMADHDFQVACYNRTASVTEEVFKKYPHANMHAFYNLEEFVNALEKPRKIMLMIKAGQAVDAVIGQLLPLLSTGDIILDGGNSFFQDTIKRSAELEAKGIHYFGVGISGGEEGARKGPAIMPGGKKEIYPQIQDILESIAAKAEGEPCCHYIGTDGAGHFVKMVHNGIEYADMQLLAETYLLLKEVAGLSNKEISDIFVDWNKGELHSYLLGITADILADKDVDGTDLIDHILDLSSQKGTGKWTGIEALNEGIDVSLITAACNARFMSNFLTERQSGSKLISKTAVHPQVKDDFIESVRKSLYVGKIVAYAQGFSLYKAASTKYEWHLDLGEIASIFRGGCIIQARFLNDITNAYAAEKTAANLLFTQFFLKQVNANKQDLQLCVKTAIDYDLPVPALLNAIGYLNIASSKWMGANLIEAQRDYFGAHTFARTDKTGKFHHIWQHRKI